MRELHHCAAELRSIELCCTAVTQDGPAELTKTETRGLHIRKQLTSADPSWWQGMSPMSLPRQLDVPRHGQLTFYTASYRFGRKCTSDPFFQT